MDSLINRFPWALILHYPYTLPTYPIHILTCKFYDVSYIYLCVPLYVRTEVRLSGLSKLKYFDIYPFYISTPNIDCRRLTTLPVRTRNATVRGLLVHTWGFSPGVPNACLNRLKYVPLNADMGFQGLYQSIPLCLD